MPVNVTARRAGIDPGDITGWAGREARIPDHRPWWQTETGWCHRWPKRGPGRDAGTKKRVGSRPTLPIDRLRRWIVSDGRHRRPTGRDRRPSWCGLPRGLPRAALPTLGARRTRRLVGSTFRITTVCYTRGHGGWDRGRRRVSVSCGRVDDVIHSGRARRPPADGGGPWPAILPWRRERCRGETTQPRARLCARRVVVIRQESEPKYPPRIRPNARMNNRQNRPASAAEPIGAVAAACAGRRAVAARAQDRSGKILPQDHAPDRPREDETPSRTNIEKRRC